jgi:ADP-ribose pyrophosphatase YjhB (NUDIX family)
MKESEVQQLKDLLRQLRAEGLTPPRMPVAVWKALRGLVVQTAVEVLITRNGKDFLLTWREDEYWKGWHIPGGFLCPEESLEAACKRLAKNELEIDVFFQRLAAAYVWPDHPYASVVSLVCICTTGSEPRNGSFHQAIPHDVVPQHRAFLRSFLDGASLSTIVATTPTSTPR